MFVFDINAPELKQAANADIARLYADKVDGYVIGSEADLKDLTSFQMVQLHNLLIKFPPVVNAFKSSGAELPNEVKRFADKESATRRVWALASKVPAAAPKAEPEPTTGSRRQDATPKAERKQRTSPGIGLKPADKARDCRVGSVQALFVDVLSRG